MTGTHQYTAKQEQIADLLRDADRRRLAAADHAPATHTNRPTRLARISRRLARPSTT